MAVRVRFDEERDFEPPQGSLEVIEVRNPPKRTAEDIAAWLLSFLRRQGIYYLLVVMVVALLLPITCWFFVIYFLKLVGYCNLWEAPWLIITFVYTFATVWKLGRGGRRQTTGSSARIDACGLGLSYF